MAGIKAARGARGKADKLVRQILLSRFKNCERCGGQEYLQVSHIVGRRYSATRCDLKNVQFLCARCHRRFTDWPQEFTDWIMDSIGPDAYIALKVKAETVTKVDWDEVVENLTKELKESS